MSSTFATRLSPDTREQLARLRRDQHGSQRDARAAEREAEQAAVLAVLETQGWKDYTATPTAQCPRCTSVGTRFVSRALREGGPRVLACLDCATKGTP